jgi:hypothetical protein
VTEIALRLDEQAAVALATIIRRLTPDDYGDALAARGVDVQAWYRAVDALSPQLPALPSTTSSPSAIATYPGEPESFADVGRQRFQRDRKDA